MLMSQSMSDRPVNRVYETGIGCAQEFIFSVASKQRRGSHCHNQEHPRLTVESSLSQPPVEAPMSMMISSYRSAISA